MKTTLLAAAVAALAALVVAAPVELGPLDPEAPSIQSILELPTGWGARTHVRARG
jgi:hypothetical protein